VTLNKNVKHLREEISRLKMKQRSLISQAVFIEDLLDSTCTLEGTVKDMANSVPHFTPTLANRFRIAFTLTVWPCLSKVIGTACAILSSFLILIEVLGLCNKSIEDYLRGIISRRDNWAVASISVVIFCYAIFCVHLAIFRIKFSGFYNLYYGHQTDTASLLYSGMYV
jgi:LMBR1-like membrane protein